MPIPQENNSANAPAKITFFILWKLKLFEIKMLVVSRPFMFNKQLAGGAEYRPYIHW